MADETEDSAQETTSDTPAPEPADDFPTIRDLLNRINESHEALNARITALSERIPEQSIEPAEEEDKSPEKTTVEDLPDTSKTRKPHKRRGMLY